MHMRPDASAFTLAELGVVVVGIAVNASHRVLSPGTRLAANLGAASAAVGIARHGGASWDDLGLSAETLSRGVRWGVTAGAAVVVGVGAASRVKVVRAVFVDQRVTRHGRARAIYELAARIPLETALSEEVLFRGALLGLALRRQSTPTALASSSVLFGLWHVLPTWAGLDDSALGRMGGSHPAARIGSVAAVVAATTAAGVALGMLRLRSRSVLASVLAHAALNMASFLVARSAARPVPAVVDSGVRR